MAGGTGRTSSKGICVKTLLRSPMSLAISTVAIALLSGCASTSYTRAPAPAPNAASGFVSQEMGGTIRSIEQSLQVLVDLERGDEGPRKPTALGTTVAGAAGPNAAPVRMPNAAVPQSELGQARIAEHRQLSRQDLNTRIRLVWTGDAEGLLRELSRKVGFSFSTSGTGQAPVVHLNHKEATVEQVLRDIAQQIDAVADVKVDTANRRVVLAYKTISTQ